MDLSPLGELPERWREQAEADSGAIEQDADLVIFAFRPEVYERQGSPRWRDAQGKAELIVAKLRNGPIDTVACRFRKDLMTFEPLDA